jgi:hypothetical protein
MRTALYISGTAALAMLCVVCGLLSWGLWSMRGVPGEISTSLSHVRQVLERVDTTSALLLDCKGNPNCVTSEFRAIAGSMRSSFGEVAKAAPRIAKAAQKTADNLESTTAQFDALADTLDAQAVRTSDSLDARMKDLTGEVEKFRVSFQPAIDSGNQAAKTIQVAIGDATPPVVDAAKAFRGMSEDAAKAMQVISEEVPKIAKNTTQATANVVEATKPQKWYMKIGAVVIKGALGFLVGGAM